MQVDQGALFYSYDVGNVHVIVLCPYADVSRSSAQTAFLTADLAAVDRAVTPWLISVWVRATVQPARMFCERGRCE